MHRHFLLLLIILSPLGSLAQCTCQEQFAFVKEQITNNYAGYRDKVALYGKDKFDAITTRQNALAKENPPPAYCYVAIKEWLDFFRDGHVQLYSEDVKHPDSTAVKRRIETCEVINIAPVRLRELEKSKGIEGVYVHSDSMYTIAVVKNKNKFRDYVGVIVDSRTDTWKPGQVKLEMKKENDTMLRTLLYMRDHSCRLQHYGFSSSSINGDEWLRVGGKQQIASVEEDPESPVNIKKLSDKTLYLQILTFHASYAKLIDSIVKQNEALLRTTPNLILDVRNNGGGADFSYRPLLPYIYTGPAIGVGVDVLATKDNITNWTTDILDNPDIPEDTKLDVREIIDSMRRHPGRFVSSSEDDTVEIENPSEYPKKVAVLINNNCASSTEQFLLVARQSKRVTLMGQHTHGILDYSNVRSIQSPCNEISLFYATTRSRRVDKGMAIDNVGIQPNVVLPDNKDLIEQARKYLEK